MAVERGEQSQQEQEQSQQQEQEPGLGGRRRDQQPPLARLRDFDGTVMPLLGGFGQYQKRLILLTWIPALFIGFSQSSDSFFTAEPDFSCRNGSGGGRSQVRLVLARQGGGERQQLLLNSTGRAAAAAGDAFPSTSRQYPANSSERPCQCSAWDYTLRAALSHNIVTKWNLVCDSSWKVHIAKFSLLVGLIIGYLVTGCLADWVGRQLVLAVSVVLMLISGLTVALSVDATMFSTLRFFEGFSLAGIFLTLYATRIELSLPRNRFVITMIATFITMGGQLLMPGLAILCRDWQILQAIIICPFILMLSYWCIFPESLRWLLATHQLHAAKHLFLDFAHKNRVNLEDDIKGFLTELDKEQVASHNKTCIVKIIRTRILWKHILVLCVNSLTGFGIHYCFVKSMMDHKIEESNFKFLKNFYAEYYIMEVIGILSCAAMCGLVSLMGRRGTLLLFTIITALASLLQLGLINHMSENLQDPFSVTFSIVGMFASHAVGNLSIFFCAELTPTVIRGGGLGLVLASAGFGRLTAPIMELHNQKGYFLHHVIFTCCTMICIICILLLPESRGLNLPETIDDGDNYTRQPLLPPKKAEQPLLANQTELKDYSGLQETPGPSDSTTEITTANGNGIRSI